MPPGVAEGFGWGPPVEGASLVVKEVERERSGDEVVAFLDVFLSTCTSQRQLMV